MRSLFFKKTISTLLLLSLFWISGAFAQSNEVVIIDSDYTLKQQVLDNLPQATTVLEINGQGNPWAIIREFMEQNNHVNAIHLFANTTPTSFRLGNIVYDSTTIEREFEFAMLEGLYQGTHLDLLIYDCQIGSNQVGLSLLKTISDKSYFNIAIATNCNTVFDNNLSFDHTTRNQLVKSSIFN